MIVPLPILDAECTVGLRRAFQTDGLGMEIQSLGLHVLQIFASRFLFLAILEGKILCDCDDVINFIELAAADIRNLPRQLTTVRG
jgi:hypothetical protein